MLFKDFKSFRDYDRKFVKVTNVDSKYKKKSYIENLNEPLYGILYIDRTCGTTLRIVGDTNTKIEDSIILLRASMFGNMQFEVFEGTDYLKETLDNINDVYYDDKRNEILEDTDLDEFRYENFPEDVIAILPDEKKLERMWTRLVSKTNQDNLYIAELLDDSYYDKDYKTGEKVAVILHQEGNFKGLIINGIVEIANK